MEVAVHVAGVTKTYARGATTALHGISFDVHKGEIFGVLGPDGAGKSTLFRILATLLLPDAGTATMCGLDVVKDYRAIRTMTGYMPGRFALYQDLTIEENLEFFATIFGTTVSQNLAAIEDIYVQIEPFKNRQAGKLSGGMKQKLALCCALIHEPRVLILDEPTTGVDPVSRQEFWEMLARLKERGIAIVVSTPYMDEASRCDRIALMQKGRILELDSLAEILRRRAEPTFAVRGANKHKLLRLARAFPGTRYCFAFGTESHMVLQADAGPQEAEAFLRQHGAPDARVVAVAPNIEDVFIGLLQEHAP